MQLTTVLIIFAGIPFGLFFRKNPVHQRYIFKILSVVVWALLTLLGMKLGSDALLMAQIHTLGLQGISVGLVSILGSLFVGRIVGKYAFHDAFVDYRFKSEKCNEEDSECIPMSKFMEYYHAFKGSVIVLFFFFFGLAMGVMGLTPEYATLSVTSTWVLYALLILAGMTIGFDLRAFSIIRELKGRILLVPFAIMSGSALGAIIVSFFFSDLSAIDAVAVAFGFGYYSLAPMMISEIVSPALGSVALVANMVHEIVTLPFATLMVRYFGNLAPIMSGGAAAMDTCLPSVAQNSGERYAIIAIFSGMVLTVFVPILVPLVLSFR